MATQTDPYGLVGTTIRQRYSVDYFVGVGRYSAVYRGTELETLRHVALKFFKVRGDLRASQRPLIANRMAEAASALTDIAEHCPRICEVREMASLVTAGGRWLPFMVQSWLEGNSLETILEGEHTRRDQPRTLAQAMELLAPVADALAYGHARGVVHGSLAPRSIVIRENAAGSNDDWCVVDLLDLGVASMVENAQEKDRAFHEAPVTASCFVPAYGAPEQFSPEYGSVGPWSDVFALALILIQLTTGVPPLGEGTDDQLEAASKDPERRPTPRSQWLDLGQYVESVFERALAVRPHARYATVSSFWEALRAAHRMSLLRSASSGSSPAFEAAPISMRAPEDSYADVLDSELEPEDTDTDLVMARSARPTGMSDLFEPSPASVPVPSRSMPPPIPNSSGYKRRFAKQMLTIGASTLVIAGSATAIFEGAQMLGAPVSTESTLRPTAAIAANASMDTSVAPSTPALATDVRCPAGMIKIAGGRSRAVAVAPYCIDANEVSVERYKKCSADGLCKKGTKATNEWSGITGKQRKTLDPLCNARDAARGNQSMNCVDASTAAAFCSAQGERLPTEAERELATRSAPAGDARFGAREGTARASEWTADSTSHNRQSPMTRSYEIGFRCAKSL